MCFCSMDSSLLCIQLIVILVPFTMALFYLAGFNEIIERLWIFNDFLLILHMISIDGKVPCQYKCVNCMKVLAYLTQPVSQVVSWKKDDVFFHTSIHPLD